MSPKSCSMDYRSHFQPSISVAKDRAPNLLGSEKEENFYAELWRQILEITLDDNTISFKNQGLCPVAAPSLVSCSDWQMNNRNIEPWPAWQLSQPRSRCGTGVFIPSIAKTERSGRQGRAARKKTKAKKQVENK